MNKKTFLLLSVLSVCSASAAFAWSDKTPKPSDETLNMMLSDAKWQSEPMSAELIKQHRNFYEDKGNKIIDSVTLDIKELETQEIGERITSININNSIAYVAIKTGNTAETKTANEGFYLTTVTRANKTTSLFAEINGISCFKKEEVSGITLQMPQEIKSFFTIINLQNELQNPKKVKAIFSKNKEGFTFHLVGDNGSEYKRTVYHSQMCDNIFGLN